MSTFSKDVLVLDAAVEVSRIVDGIRAAARRFRRRGAVVALSGGIDSSVVGALCVEALGAKRVFGLSLPEQESSSATPGLSDTLIRHLGIDSETVNITPILESYGCYETRIDAVREVIPDFTAEWKFKIVLPPVTESDEYRTFSVVAQSPDGREETHKLTLSAYLQILAATNYKQRTRKTLEYFHADRLNYVVAGTPNLLEYDQGFFVKLGDGAADIKPIAHLYKTQVYQLAEYLGVPKEISSRPPTTDTYSLPQSQEEFYFSLPYDKMDLCLYALNEGVAADQVAPAAGLSGEQVERVFADIRAKRAVADYLHAAPMTIAELLG
jgi:NAD+ synthase